MFNITDQTVHAAFDLLESNVESAAVARAMRERREHEVKAAKAKGFLESEGSVAEREHKAVRTDEYKAACEALYEAIQADERHRNEKSKCEAIIEAWRSCQATQRSMGKVA